MRELRFCIAFLSRTSGILATSAVTAKAQTHETLTKQQGELQSQLAEVMQAITALDAADAEQTAAATAAATTAAASGSESYDALDLFLLNNAADAKEERRQALIAQRGAVEADLRQVSALLKLVQPALPQLRTLASSTTTSASSSSAGSSTASSVSSKAQQLPAMAMSSVFAAPAAVPKRALEQSTVTGGSSGDADADSGSAKKKVKFAAEPEEQLADLDSSDMKTDSAAAAVGASASTRSSSDASDFVPASTNNSTAAAKPAKKARVYTAAHKPAAAKAKAVPGTDDSSKVDTWTVPKGQTGDGKTSLNAKLGY
jgi:hypothetical protein